VDEGGIPWAVGGETVECETDTDCGLDTIPEHTMSGEALEENARSSEGIN
jgi:hypothetical protein